ncbi:MAG: HAMP domain-containing protein [Anaerolineales bacterium]|nr:HAMP domain-containing protein [Anaerolineales bacterium]
MRKFLSMSAQSRLFIVFGLLALVAALNLVVGIINTASFQEMVTYLRISALALERSGSAQANLAREQLAVRNVLLSDSPEDWGQVYTYSGQFYDYLTSESLNSLSSEQDQALAELDVLRQQYDRDVEEIITATWEGELDPEGALLQVRASVDPLAMQLNQLLDDISARHLAEIAENTRQIEGSIWSSANTARWAILILAILLVAGMFVANQITQPLHSLTSALIAFQNNTYQRETLEPYLDSRDELGQLARAIDAMATSITESNRLKDQFLRSASRFIPTQYLEFLEKPTITDVNLGDHVAAEMAVMFSDIRGFTTASERMTPQENFDFINEYLKLVSPVIQRHEGFIVKFLGDGMMAIFPYGVDDAVRAGIEKQQKVIEFNAMLAQRGFPPVSVGIGIHTGQMMVGMIGEERRIQGDAFSDNVNLTSRVESLNKFYGTSMIVSEETLRGLQQPVSYRMRYLGKVQVKGRQAPLGLYEVYEGLSADVAARKDASKASFERGIELYTRGDFAGARQAFDAVLEIDPDDKTARYYLERCFEWADRIPPSHWDGVIVMMDK